LTKATASFLIIIPTLALAFTQDITAPALSSTFYGAPAASSTQYTINADYSKTSAAPYNMIVSSMIGGDTLRIKVLLPPGTKQAVVRGESNDWIGVSGQQPVVGVIPQDITGTCPTTADNIIYTCSGVTLQPPAGGLSMMLYTGDILTTPKYVNFVLHVPSGNFSFSSLNIAIQINDVAAYTTWRNARPWAGGTSTNSIDGLGSNGGTTTTPTGCPTGSALMPSVSSDLTLTIPRLHFTLGGLPEMKVILKPVRDPNDSSQIVFELMSLASPDFFFLPC